MHIQTALISSILLISSTAAAANVSIIALLSEVPICSLTCLAPVTGLLLSDPVALCLDVPAQAKLSACIQPICNYTEQIQIGRLNSKLCEGIPFESRSLEVSITAVVFAPLALLCIALRLYSRWSITRRFGYDDWIIITVSIFLVVELGIDLNNTFGNGFGRHYWNVDPSKIEQLLKTFYIAEMIYIAILTLVKVSILLFYLRVFENTPWFRIAALTTLGLTIASGIGLIFTIGFQCMPIAGVWNRNIAAKCLDTNKLIYASAAIGIILDVVILVLPIPELLYLHMNLRKKLNVLFMFSIGGFACITSIIRLKYVVSFGASTDQTWDNAAPALWSMVELCVATICACLPSMRALFSRWLPYLFDIQSTVNSSFRNKSNPSSSGTQNGRMNSDKGGASSHKRNLTDPDDDLLKTFHDIEAHDREGHGRAEKDESEVKVWINPRFDDKGNVVTVGELSPPRSSPAVSASTGPMFTIEGPRHSDEISILTPDDGIQMADMARVKAIASPRTVVRRGHVAVTEHTRDDNQLPPEGYRWPWSGEGDDDSRRHRAGSAPPRPAGSFV